ncbi:copper resistance system multicopper oxidase [Methylolobus aquaticus]
MQRSRRRILQGAMSLGISAGAARWFSGCATRPATPAYFALSGSQVPLQGDVIDLVVGHRRFIVDGQAAEGVAINGTVPGPVIRLREGQRVTLRVTNQLDESTSIHWHGLLVPAVMDGVPGVSFGGIPPGETFVYRFPIRQSGTYWFHSHSGFQELLGMYGAIIIDPEGPEPFRYDRDYVVLLSDWSPEPPELRMGHLKKWAGYYNFQKRTARELLADAGRVGWLPALKDYLRWDRMRMDPTDFADITGYSSVYLVNGQSPTANWTALFDPGERVRLRVINAASMTFFDLRIPDLAMTVVQADGQNVQPFIVDEFRIGPAETYDVIVELPNDRAYTIFAETMDRSGYARGTLAPRPGMTAEIPPRRPRPTRTMEDMGMRMDMGGDEHMDMDMSDTAMPPAHIVMPEAAGSGMGHEHHHPVEQPSGTEFDATPRRSRIPGAEPVKHGPDDHGTGNQQVAEYSWNRMHEPGRGLGGDGRRVLAYTDLASLAPNIDRREPSREIELHLTGQMERYLWSFDGQKYSDAPAPIHLHYGERVRLTFVNDTMMEHPLHLHGMWMELENGHGAFLPRKHTVIVKPAERLSVAVHADAPGRWAFHCHLLLHMEAGMFRVVAVTDPAA